VKVLRPGVERRLRSDLETLYFAARSAERHSAEARRLRMIEVVDTLARSVAIEMDLRLEAAAIAEMRDNVKDDPDFRVPEIDWDRTARTVLTLEWIDGTPMSDRAGLAKRDLDLPALGRALMQTFLRHALRDGFFHADMHPGNLFVDAEGRLCAVDFGIMGRLDARMRRFLAETLGGFVARDYERVAEAHFEVGFVSRAYSVQTFAQALRAIGEPILGLTAREVSMGRLLEQLFETTRRFDMQLQPQLILLQKTMMTVEGVCRALDPDFDIWEHSRPVLETWMVKNMGPEARLRDAAEGLGSLVKLARDLPELLRDTEVIAAQLAGGGLRLHPDSVAAVAQMQIKRTRHVRVALWLTAGALGLLAVGMM
jgi:ubiquinone biosynthesis protein